MNKKLSVAFKKLQKYNKKQFKKTWNWKIKKYKINNQYQENENISFN